MLMVDEVFVVLLQPQPPSLVADDWTSRSQWSVVNGLLN